MYVGVHCGMKNWLVGVVKVRAGGGGGDVREGALPGEGEGAVDGGQL